ncbi:MAG: hypothetical protein ACYC3I_08445 [Gemmataceae bacterium]
MKDVLSGEGLDLLFRNARTHNVWKDLPENVLEYIALRIGYGDASKLHPRSPRLGFEEAYQVF